MKKETDKSQQKNSRAGRVFWLVVLQMAVLLYATTTLFSKQAAKYSFPQRGYLLCYGALIMVLGLYALIWQQIIKHLPLTVAHANKAVSVIWGVVFATAIYKETVSVLQLIGCVIIICGTVMYVTADNQEQKETENSGEDQV